MDGDRSPGEAGSESLRDRLARWGRSPWVRRLETVLLVGLLAFVLYRLAPQLSALTGIGGAADDGPAPTFSVTTLDGDTLSSEDLRGRVVVVNFWATWCPPCRLEMPSLQSLHEKRSDEDVVVLGLSTDRGPEAAVRSFLEERSISYPVARADRATRAAFGGIAGIPTTVLLDRSGRIRHRIVGYVVPPALNAAVDRLLDRRRARDTTCTPLLEPASRSGTGSREPSPLPPGWRVERLSEAPLPELEWGDGDDGEDGRVRIRTEGGAGLALMPLPEGPVLGPGSLRWQWRVERGVPGADLRNPAKDDSPLRIFVAFGAGVPDGLGDVERALFYSWGGAGPSGARFRSHVTDRIGVWVLRTSSALGAWHEERRDPFRDYRRIFGEEPPPVSAVGFVTDADQTGGRVRASLEGLCWEEDR